MVTSRVPRKILGVIPARFASTRFPGKVLAPISSKSMLQHVYERASQARYLTSTIVATDDERVYEAARRFGARVRMTRSDHLSGTDRAAEVQAGFRRATACLEAARLAHQRVIESRQVVMNIAAQVGFNDLSYFNRVFRKQVGCSPRAFRAQQP